jgi:ubiquinone/menaquinone biosynthesis C-methylase UbiE
MEHLLGAIAAYWDGRAATFDEQVDHGLAVPATRAAWSRWLSVWLPAPPARIADLGRGSGSLAVLLAARGYDVTASDISAQMVRRTRHKAAAAGVEVEVAVADAASPPLAARSIDVVLVRHRTRSSRPWRTTSTASSTTTSPSTTTCGAGP